MRSERIQFLKDISEMFTSSDFVYMVSYTGLSVAKMHELRTVLRANDAECHVLKNTFIRKAAEQLGWEDLANANLTGDTAVIIGTDCAGAAKAVKEFAKKNEQVNIKLGQMDGKLLTSAEVEQIAELPSLDEMRAMFLSVLEAPKRNLVGVLNQKVSTIAFVLQAIIDKKS